MAPNVSWTRHVRQADGSIARHSPASSAPATALHAKRARRMGPLCACRAQLTWSWTRLFASRSVTAKKSSLIGKLQIAPSALSASIQTGPTKDAGHALTRTVSTAYSSRVLFNLSGKRNALHAKMIFGLTLKRECAGLNVIQHPSSISIHKAAVLVQPVIIKMQRMILADPAHQAANLVNYLRIQPSQYAWLVSLPAKKLMRSINQFAAEIAPQINTSMHLDGNAKSVLQANMWLKIREDVEYVPNIALAAIRILLQKRLNALSATLVQPLIRIQKFVFLLANQAAYSITLRLKLADNAHHFNRIHQKRKSANPATSKIVLTASTLSRTRHNLNVFLVQMELRWTVKRWLAELHATRILFTIILLKHVIGVLKNKFTMRQPKSAKAAISAIATNVDRPEQIAQYAIRVFS